jgi:hypothetical protein
VTSRGGIVLLLWYFLLLLPWLYILKTLRHWEALKYYSLLYGYEIMRELLKTQKHGQSLINPWLEHKVFMIGREVVL